MGLYKCANCCHCSGVTDGCRRSISSTWDLRPPPASTRPCPPVCRWVNTWLGGHNHRASLQYLVMLSQTLVVTLVLAHGVTNAIDISTNKQCFAPNLLCLKLIKCNQKKWSRFKQTLKKSLHKPIASYTIDRFEKRSDWCRAEQKPGHNKQRTQQHSCTSVLNFLISLNCF